MDEVFILHHVHELEDGHENTKLIGVYRTREDAESVLAWIKEQPGFRDNVEGFTIDSYRVNHTGWTDGFVTAYQDGTFSN